MISLFDRFVDINEEQCCLTFLFSKNPERGVICLETLLDKEKSLFFFEFIPAKIGDNAASGKVILSIGREERSTQLIMERFLIISRQAGGSRSSIITNTQARQLIENITLELQRPPIEYKRAFPWVSDHMARVEGLAPIVIHEHDPAFWWMHTDGVVLFLVSVPLFALGILGLVGASMIVTGVIAMVATVAGATGIVVGASKLGFFSSVVEEAPFDESLLPSQPILA